MSIAEERPARVPAEREQKWAEPLAKTPGPFSSRPRLGPLPGLFGFTLPPELWKPPEWNVTGSPEDPLATAEGTLEPGNSITGGGRLP